MSENSLRLSGQGVVSAIKETECKNCILTSIFVRVDLRSDSRKRAQRKGIEKGSTDGSYDLTWELKYFGDPPAVEEGNRVRFHGFLQQDMYRGPGGAPIKAFSLHNATLHKAGE